MTSVDLCPVSDTLKQAKVVFGDPEKGRPPLPLRIFRSNP